MVNSIGKPTTRCHQWPWEGQGARVRACPQKQQGQAPAGPLALPSTGPPNLLQNHWSQSVNSMRLHRTSANSLGPAAHPAHRVVGQAWRATPDKPHLEGPGCCSARALSITLPCLFSMRCGGVLCIEHGFQSQLHHSQLCDPGPSLNLSEAERPQVGGGAWGCACTRTYLTELLRGRQAHGH